MNTQDFPWIVALDVPSLESACEWVRRLHPHVSIFKVGMQLFYQAGPDAVLRLQELGAKIFLDLKLHDIPNTVAHACESLLPLQVDFLTIHASGGLEMLQAAQSVIQGSCTKLLGVTALTSMDQATLRQISLNPDLTPDAWALHLAELVKEAALYGLVCSAQENQGIRTAYSNSIALVNPGIRLSGEGLQDQKRVMTPKAAFEAGANYIVVGRPILNAPDPLAVIEHIKQDYLHATRLSTSQS